MTALRARARAPCAIMRARDLEAVLLPRRARGSAARRPGAPPPRTSASSGDGMTTSSPRSSRAWQARYSACLPPIVIATSSAAKRRPKSLPVARGHRGAQLRQAGGRRVARAPVVERGRGRVRDVCGRRLVGLAHAEVEHASRPRRGARPRAAPWPPSARPRARSARRERSLAEPSRVRRAHGSVPPARAARGAAPVLLPQPPLDHRRHQLAHPPAELEDLLHQPRREIRVALRGHHEHGLDARVQAAVHERHLELVLEVRDRAQPAHDHGGPDLLRVVHEQAREGVDLHARRRPR